MNVNSQSRAQPENLELMPPIRTAMKGLAERLLCGSGVAGAVRRRRRHDAIILAYHNIVPEGDRASGDTSLHLPQGSFARQLDLLMKTHDIVPLEAILSPGSRSSGRPRAAITFDDASRGAMTAGVHELTRRSLPATVFVAPAFVGGDSFWWDAVTGAAGAALSDHERNEALTRFGGRDGEIRVNARAQGWAIRPVPEHQACVTEAELREAQRCGVVIASHTWSHPNLAVLAEAELATELERPLAWLRSHFSGVMPWLAYPYGLSSPTVEAATAAAGYEAALRVDGGWALAGSSAYAMPRLNVPAGLSLKGFELRVSGIMTA